MSIVAGQPAAPAVPLPGEGAYTLIKPRPGWRGVDVHELWQYRELLYFLVWRDIKVRYKQTVVGAAWAIIQPVCSMVVFSVIFGRFAGLPSDGAPYPVFVYAGLLPWLFFSNAVSRSSQSLVTQTRLVTKIYFPRLFVPASSIGVGLVDFGLGFAVYVAILAWFAYLPGPAVLLVPLLLLLTVAAALGTGLLLASLTIVYRDFRMAVPFLVQIWMYLSPVVYPVTLVPEHFRWIMLVNPLTGIIGGFRSALLNQPVDWTALGAATAVTGVLLVAGLFNFRRMERRFADVA